MSENAVGARSAAAGSGRQRSARPLEVANKSRAQSAALAEASQIADLGDLATYSLPRHLREVAEARRDHPELSIALLGSHLGVSKDVCNGRLRRFWKAIGYSPGQPPKPKPVAVKGLRRLSLMQEEVLVDFWRGDFGADMWVRPMDIGGKNNSRRSSVLAQLEQHGLVESRIRTAGIRNSKLYRLTETGRNYATHRILRRCAAGSYPKEAAVELLIGATDGRLADSENAWIVTEGGDAWIDSRLIPTEFTTDDPNEAAVLDVVVGLLQCRPVHIYDLVTQTDPGHLALILAALGHAGGLFCNSAQVNHVG